jgi:hypothetical protein
MNDQQRRRRERGARVRDFAGERGADFPAGSKGAQASTRIKQLVAQIDTLDASLSTHARTTKASTSAKRDASTGLRDLLTRIARTARAIALDGPELKRKFRLPVGTISGQTLVSTARSFHAEATPLKTQFIAYGMSDNFLDDLEARITDFESHAEQQNTGKNARVADRAAIAAALDELDAEVARFDAIVRNKFVSDPATLAAWEAAHHTERDPQKRKTGAKQSAPPAAPPK